MGSINYWALHCPISKQSAVNKSNPSKCQNLWSTAIKCYPQKVKEYFDRSKVGCSITSRDIRISSKHFSCFGHRQRRGQNKAVSSPGSKDSCSWVCRWHRGWLAAEVVGVGPGCPISQPRSKKRGNMIFIRSKKLRVTYKFSLSERQQVRMAGGHWTLSLKIPTNQRSKEPTSAEAYLRFVPWSWAS